MTAEVLIDGNNLLHAVREEGPGPAVGRDTLLRMVERWARTREVRVSLVFDGPSPGGAMLRSLSPDRVRVFFSAPATADDLLVEMIRAAKDPGRVRVVTSDKAIRHEAGIRRCGVCDSPAFVAELFPPPSSTPDKPQPPAEKPTASAEGESDHWKQTFGGDDAEPFDGHDAMLH